MQGGGGQSAGGSGMGGTVYTPRWQGAADDSYTGIMQSLIEAMGPGGSNTYSAQNYPAAKDFTNRFLTASPYEGQALQGAETAGGYGMGTLFPMSQGSADELGDWGRNALPYGSQLLSQGFDPAYGQAVSDVRNNPYYAGAMSGAQQGAAYGAQGAEGMMSAGRGILDAGFDPQSALYNRTQQQLMDQSNAVNSMSGLGGTPYGASVTSNAMGKFGIDWQNQQLGRQTQAAGAAAPLFQAAPGLAASSAAMPSGVYSGQINQLMQALNARNQAGNQGAGAAGSFFNSVGQGLRGANDLGLSAAEGLTKLSGAPYSTGATVASNAMSGLSNLTNLGNDQYGQMEKLLGYLQSYMTGGQNASQVSGQLGQQGFSQTAQGIGGALAGANMLFGSGSSAMFPGAAARAAASL